MMVDRTLTLSLHQDRATYLDNLCRRLGATPGQVVGAIVARWMGENLMVGGAYRVDVDAEVLRPSLEAAKKGLPDG